VCNNGGATIHAHRGQTIHRWADPVLRHTYCLGLLPHHRRADHHALTLLHHAGSAWAIRLSAAPQAASGSSRTNKVRAQAKAYLSSTRLGLAVTRAMRAATCSGGSIHIKYTSA